jgi:hypothetical protein
MFEIKVKNRKERKKPKENMEERSKAKCRMLEQKAEDQKGTCLISLHLAYGVLVVWLLLRFTFCKFQLSPQH